MYVMLVRGRENALRRCVRHKKTGEILRTLTFAPGRSVKIGDREQESIQNDLDSGVLVECEVSEASGRPIYPMSGGDEGESVEDLVAQVDSLAEALSSAEETIKGLEDQIAELTAEAEEEEVDE